MKEMLKVIKRERHYDDTEDGITYITTLEKKVGKKGEPTYTKFSLKVSSGDKDFYDSVSDGETLLVDIKQVQTKLEGGP